MLRSMELACCQSVPLFRSGNRVVITYGNGPQVENLLVQQENSAPEIPQHLLDICVAMTQGQIGTMLQQVLDKILRVEGIQRDVVTLVSKGAIVIVGVGGGIPVILEPDGS